MFIKLQKKNHGINQNFTRNRISDSKTFLVCQTLCSTGGLFPSAFGWLWCLILIFKLQLVQGRVILLEPKQIDIMLKY